MAMRLAAIVLLLPAVLLMTGCDGGGGGGGESVPPTAPVRLNAVQESGGVSLSWETNSTDGVSGFNVYRAEGESVSADGSPINGQPVPDPAYLDDTVVDGTLYSYTVTAVGDGGESRASGSVQIRVFSDPPNRP